MYVKVGRYEIQINYVFGWKKDVPKSELPQKGRILGRPVDGGGIVIGWDAHRDGKAIGFGELTVVDNGTYDFHCHGEAMSQTFCEAVLVALSKTWKCDAPIEPPPTEMGAE